MKRLILLTVVAVLVLSGYSCKEKQVTEEEVLAVIDSFEHKLDWVNHRIAQESWRLFVNGPSDSLEFYQRLRDYVISDREAWSILIRGDRFVKGEDDQRRLQLLFATLLRGTVEADAEVRQLRDSLMQVLVSFEPEFDGQRAGVDQLAGIMRSDDSRARREMAYLATNAVGERLADGLSRLIRLRNQKARKLGYNNFFAMAFDKRSISLQQYLTLLKQVDSLTASPYLAVLERLSQSRSSQAIDVFDLAHGYAPVLAEVDGYFPTEGQLDILRAGMADLGFDLDKLPIYDAIDESADGHPTAHTLTVDCPFDQRVIARPGPGLDGQEMLLAAYGRAVHAAYIAEKSPLYKVVDGAWAEGMARLFSDLGSDSRWLTDYAGVPSSTVTRFQQAQRDMVLIDLRMMLVRLKFEYEAYTSPRADLNKLYWDIFEQVTSLPRHEEIKPWAAVPSLLTEPVGSPGDLLGEIVARQTLDYLQEVNGAVVGTRETRSFLVQNYFRFGGRYSWSELLERGTGESLNPSVLVADLNP